MRRSLQRRLIHGAVLLLGPGGGVGAFGQIVTDGTVGPAVALPGPAYDVGPQLGTRRGGNLFHSFTRFDVPAGETATFSGPADVTHVLARVTGGQPSAIDGTLRSTLPNADLYLINPAGVVFGTNATIDVAGSFVVTTADVLRHADGGQFGATQPGESVLTSAPPTAFGFLAETPAPITIRGGGVTKDRATDQFIPLAGSIRVNAGKSILLAGGAVTVEGGLAVAPGGRLDVAAVASPGEVTMPASEATEPLAISEGTRLADVVFTDAGLDTGGTSGGVVTLVADDARMERTFIGARVFADVPGRGIHFELTGDLTILDTDIASDADQGGTARAGDISVRAANVSIEAVERISDIGTDSFAPGDAGNLSMDVTGTLSIVSRGGIAAVSSSAVRGGGDGGSVSIRAGRIVLSAKGVTTNPLPLGILPVVGPDGSFDVQEIAGAAVISATAFEAGGNAGRVDIVAGDVRVEEGAVISSGSLGPGAGGGLKITADRLVVARGSSPFLTGIQTATIFPTGGPGGDLEVDARELTVGGGAIVSASTFGTGNGGVVRVAADRLNVVRGGAGLTGIFASTQGPGDGGSVQIEVGRLTLRGGVIQSASGASGRAGTLDIVAGTASLTNRASVNTAALLSDGGSMSLDADRIDVVRSQVSANADGDGGNIRLATRSGLALSHSQVTARAGGDGGNIVLDADVVGLNSSRLVAAAILGDGGDIDVDATGFIQSPGSLIDASSQFGMSGRVDIKMPDMDVAASLSVLPASLAARDARLEEKCAQRAGRTGASSFLRVGRGGAPLVPGGWSASLWANTER